MHEEREKEREKSLGAVAEWNLYRVGNARGEKEARHTDAYTLQRQGWSRLSPSDLRSFDLASSPVSPSLKKEVTPLSFFFFFFFTILRDEWYYTRFEMQAGNTRFQGETSRIEDWWTTKKLNIFYWICEFCWNFSKSIFVPFFF